MLMRRYEMPWRRAYETYAGAIWLVAMAFFAAVGATDQLPRLLALPLALLCFGMGLLRIAQGVHTLVLRASLSGRAIQVIGTGDIGFLNLRAEASISAAVNYLALEREVFQVQAGPIEADGLVWWFLVDPATGTRNGWGAQNYLTVVAGP